MNSLAIISGEIAISAVIVIVVAGLICWLLWWFIGFCGLPEPFNKIARIVIALVALVFLINALLGFTGHPLFFWN